MKVLLVHNYLQSASPSGEDVVFESETELLEKNGITVIRYTRHNDEILSYRLSKKLTLPLSFYWSKHTYRDIKRIISQERPDICHVHNLFFLISPSVYRACRDMGVPVVQTLHNFRIFCANGLLYRSGRVCEECLGRSPFRGLLYGCFRNSRLYSLPVVMMEYLHKVAGTWERHVDAFIALTNFGKSKFVAAGLPGDKIYVKPNFVAAPPEPGDERGDYALYAGRITEDKGVLTLARAWRMGTGCQLRIAGDGPFMKNLYEYVEMHNIDNVIILGRLTHRETIDCMKNAGFCVFPSELLEGFPMVLAEAYACGKPVVASRLGAMEEIVRDGETGLLFQPGAPEDLAEKARVLAENPGETLRMGKRAREIFDQHYSPERNFSMLIDIYERTIG